MWELKLYSYPSAGGFKKKKGKKKEEESAQTLTGCVGYRRVERTRFDAKNTHTQYYSFDLGTNFESGKTGKRKNMIPDFQFLYIRTSE